MNQIYSSRVSPLLAAILEVGFGLFMQTFGVGHIYAGRVLRGLMIMFSYWIIQGINFWLTFVGIGYIGLVLVWMTYVVFSPLWAASTARRA